MRHQVDWSRHVIPEVLNEPTIPENVRLNVFCLYFLILHGSFHPLQQRIVHSAFASFAKGWNLAMMPPDVNVCCIQLLHKKLVNIYQTEVNRH